MKKKLLALALTATLVFSTVIGAFADSGISPEAQNLVSLGLLQGENDATGVTAEYLTKQMDRFKAAIMVLKLQGVYDEALAYNSSKNFPDASRILWPEGQNLLAYLKAHPEYGFSGMPDGTFSYDDSIDETSFLKVMLENLGYQMGVDFEWTEIKSFAKKKGIRVQNESPFTVGGLAKITDSTLRANTKAEGKPLAKVLAAAGKLDEAAAVAAGYIDVDETKLPLEVKSVTIPNLKQVQIVFNRPLTKTIANAAGNYVVRTGSTAGDLTIEQAQLQDDNKTVLLTLTKALKMGSTNKVIVKKSIGIPGDYEVKSLIANDSAFPKITGIEITGPKSFELIFSEPIILNGTGFARIDNGKFSISKMEVVNYNRLAVTTGGLTTGEHTLSFNQTASKNIKDYADYLYNGEEYTFTYEPDNRPIEASISEVQSYVSGKTERTEMVVKFNKPIILNSLEFRLNYDASSAKSISTTSISSTEYKLIFNTYLSPGKFTLYLTNASSTKPAKDAFGNKLSNTSLKGEIVVDTSLPAITSVTNTGANTVEIVFSKAMDRSSVQNKDNYVIRDPQGNKMELESQVYADGSNKKYVTLRTKKAFANGTYSVEISGLKDATQAHNEMPALTMNFECKDESSPVMLAAFKDSDETVKIIFSEPINAAAGKKGSWSVTGTTLNDVELQDDQKTVLVYVDDVDYIRTLKCALFTDLEGNPLAANNVAKISGFDVTITIGKRATIKPYSVALVAADQINLKIDSDTIENINDDDIIVRQGSKRLSVNDVNTDTVEGDGVISLILEDKLNDTTASNLTVELSEDADIRTENEMQVGWTGKLSVEDKCGPAFVEKSCKVASTYPRASGQKYGALKSVKLYFTEAIYTASVSKNSFDVSGYAIENIDVNGKTVTITVADSGVELTPGTPVIVSILEGVEDTARNPANTDDVLYIEY